MKNVLIIEDQALIAALIADELEMCGFACARIAASPKSAIALAQEIRPDLIIAEELLVNGSGIAAVEEICRDKRIPTIFASVDPDMIRTKLPKAVVVGKPLRRPDLLRAIYEANRLAPAGAQDTPIYDTPLQTS